MTSLAKNVVAIRRPEKGRISTAVGDRSNKRQVGAQKKKTEAFTRQKCHRWNVSDYLNFIDLRRRSVVWLRNVDVITFGNGF